MRRTTFGTLFTGYKLWSGYISPAIFASAATCQPLKYIALRPALTCCTAWFPVKAPKELMKSSVFNTFQSFLDPRLANVYSILMDPRRRITSSAEYGRLTPTHLGFV